MVQLPATAAIEYVAACCRTRTKTKTKTVRGAYAHISSKYYVSPPFYGAGAEKPLQKADFAMKQTNICRLSGDITK